ncbi:mersacidin/lichenicidin family type 2 lantibiotic [Calothrix sp. FACHB-1219]|uniref:mersacidin/lichenicidin family type 2 lantibiotic n=1 Tax=unclassified Calothrix TaxID=2619626 RepID=UPI00168429F9|nr:MULTISPECIES: mersacidin/lichenicidin family type 2 lantibiotic [unclassified Calothrix]MBD2208057.1 mersacidin/lichenicidin family type 2 lantibiotic [Calothrix sp. FACHB-168]MBD2222607.1 mersacidin/lichenicidin family type 2 lantibiotic [Calothrix sp. FACHB-1219]
MSNFDIIRAWKDEDYRNSLSDEQRSQLPENPAGMIELPNEITQTLAGGGNTEGVGCKGTPGFSRGIICDIIVKRLPL